MPGGLDPETLRQLLKITAMRESGGKDFRANGEPVQSPAGALYSMQVLPSTARDPGFGVQPATSQSPGEYNRVGRQLYGAFLNRYGNDPAKAWAAYHSGPGRLDRLTRTYGGNWQSHLGPVGRDYVSDNMSAYRALPQQTPQPAEQPGLPGLPTPETLFNPPQAQATAMPSPLEQITPGAQQEGGLSAKPSFEDLYAEQQSNERQTLALQQAKAEAAKQALQAKRMGMGASDWFNLSAALASRTHQRGFAGMMENVAPVLADIAARNEAAREQRKVALSNLDYDTRAGVLETKGNGLKSRMDILKEIAARNKDAQPDKGTLGSDGMWHYRDRPQQGKNSISVGGITYNQWDDGKYRRVNSDGTRSVYVLEGDQLRQIGSEPASGGQR